MLRTIISLFYAIGISCVAIGQTSNIVDLEKKLRSAEGHQRFELLIDLFRENLAVNYDSALIYSMQAIKQSIRNGDSLEIVKAYNANGFARWRLASSLCIPDFEYALGIAKRNDFLDQKKYILNNLANAHSAFANYDKSLDYNFQSLQLRLIDGDPKEINVPLNNLGVVYSYLDDFENALLYFQKSRDLKEENGISYDLDLTYTNIALAYYNLKNYKEALNNLMRVLQICESGCREDVKLEARYALAKVYLEMENISNAKNELDSAINIARRIGSRMFESQALNLGARIQLIQNEPKMALKWLNESQGLLEDTNLREQLLSNYLLYVDIYNNIGDYQMASEYQQKYIDLNKNIYSAELIKNITRIQTEHEERENIKTIAVKDQILKLQGEIIGRQKQQYAFIITITFLVLGLAFVMYRANQSQRKINQELTAAKTTIQKQNELLSDNNLMLETEVTERTRELVETNDSLKKVNEEMDNFIYKTSHDIRGPLASLKGICNVAMLDVTDEGALEYLNKLDTSAAKLNAILSRLLIINQINHSLLNPESIDFETKIEEILELERKKDMPLGIDITYSIAPDLNFRSDKAMVKIILENLIDNAIKYHNDSGRVDPFVTIDISKKGDWINVSVIDNGIGIEEDSKGKIFDLFVRATERSDSGGIGLYLSKLATIKLGGSIIVSKTEEGYTAFTVRFPLDLQPIIEKRKAEEQKREEQKQKILRVS